MEGDRGGGGGDVLGHLLDVGGDHVQLGADLVQLRLHLGEEPARDYGLGLRVSG